MNARVKETLEYIVSRGGITAAAQEWIDRKHMKDCEVCGHRVRSRHG